MNARTVTRRADPVSGRTILLYDLAEDPSELKNLADVNWHGTRIKRMLRQMRDRLLAVDPDREEIKKLSDIQDQLDRLLVPPEER